MGVNYSDSGVFDRLKSAKRFYGLRVSDIAREAGMSVATVQNQMSGKYKFDIDVVCAVARLCPGLSTRWLLTGEGSMSDCKDCVERLAESVEKCANFVQQIAEKIAKD